MKLATLRDGSRDGKLVVVSRCLTKAVEAQGIAETLQDALERWDDVSPKLDALYRRLNDGEVPGVIEMEHGQLESPLPRAYQWLDGSAYLNHAELVRKARNADIPSTMYEEPMIYQGASDSFLGPHDDILVADESWGIDLEAEIAVITDDVPMGATVEESVGHIKLIMLVNDVSLRNRMPSELAKGFGFLTSKPSTAFSPVAVTPDELGDVWDGYKLSLSLDSQVNGVSIGRPNAGVDLNFSFPQLISFATTSRELRAGTIVGSGTVSNRDRSVGSACLQEKRMIEKIETGEFVTPHLRFGDTVRIEMKNDRNESVFGAIEQRVVKYER